MNFKMCLGRRPQRSWTPKATALAQQALLGSGKGAFRMQTTAELMGGLLGISGLSQHEKWLRRQVLSSKELSVATSELKVGVGRLVRGVLEQYPDIKTCVSDVALPSNMTVISTELFAPQQFFQLNSHCSAGMTPYGLTEVVDCITLSPRIGGGGASLQASRP